jgi:NAD(P)-dependent dehydrogenase (short-subunit alcohol dehydrogenase family)
MTNQTQKLSGRVALVTGGAIRLGKAIALELARQGADIILHYNSSPDQAWETAREIEKLGAAVMPLAADLSDFSALENFCIEIEAGFKRLDILVNSAAIYKKIPFAATEPEDFEKLMLINARAPFFLTSRLLPLLRRAEKPSVVNIADIGGEQAWPNHAAYCMSKAALLSLTKVLSRELAPQIRVNAVSPGTILPAAGTSSEEAEKLRERIPLNKFGSPADIAQAVLFLCLNDFITGEIIRVDGGRMQG